MTKAMRSIHFDDQSAGPLTKSWAPNNNFQQQGQIDWVELSDKVISFTFNLLSRLSSAGVDPYTLTVGYAMANTFQLGQAGRRNIEQVMTSLKYFKGISDALWFGFGHRSLPRTMATTEQGALCMALCAALAENYDQDLAAEILHEYIKLCRIPMSLTPAIGEWRALLLACKGTLATSNLPTQLGKFMRIERGYCQILDRTEHSTVSRTFATPQSIAEALLLIAEVSRGTLASVVITGGSDTAWLAAVAEWLLDLTLLIKTDTDPEFYSNCPPSQEPQIVFNYKQADTREESSQLELTSKTFRLKGTTASRCIQDTIPNSAISGGRFKWDNCLSSAFQSDFERLMVENKALGSVIGSAARMFTGFVRADFDEAELVFPILRWWRFYSEESHGKGFVESSVQRFPELSESKREMNKAVRATFQDAKLNYESKLALIRDACMCKFCEYNFVPQEMNPVQESYCLVIITETIIALCQSLSEMIIAENLFPVRAGIEHAYIRQLAKRREFYCREKPQNLETLKRLCSIIGPIFYYLPTTGPPAESRLSEAIILFTGRKDRFKQTDIAAVSSGGICAYLDVLRDLTDLRELAWRIHVVPGRIEHGEKIFHAVEGDEEITNFHANRPNVPPTSIWDAYRMIVPRPEEWSQYTEVSVLFKEKASSLVVTYELSNGKGMRIPMIPARLSECMITNAGLISCQKENCSKQSADQDLSSQTFRQIDHHGIQVLLFNGNFFPALSLASRLMEGSHAIIRDGECLFCSLRAAAKCHAISDSKAQIEFWIISK